MIKNYFWVPHAANTWWGSGHDDSALFQGGASGKKGNQFLDGKDHLAITLNVRKCVSYSGCARGENIILVKRIGLMLQVSAFSAYLVLAS
jgi:hypothetical protein